MSVRIADVAEGLQRIARYERHDSTAIAVVVFGDELDTWLCAGSSLSDPECMARGDGSDVERMRYLGWEWNAASNCWGIRL